MQWEIGIGGIPCWMVHVVTPVSWVQ